MSTTYKFNVDITNPGQFLACCGLFELANCLDSEACAYFADGCFITSFNPEEVVKALLATTISAPKMPPKEFSARSASSVLPKTSTTIDPILIEKPFDFTIDWWLYPRGSTEFKTWSGDKQVPVKILEALIAAIKKIEQNPPQKDGTFMASLLNERSILSAQPFYFDGVYSRHSQDVGFSIADLKHESLPHNAFTELMAFIGLQRFQPRSLGKDVYEYRVWHEFLSVNIAAATSFGLLPSIHHSTCIFNVTDRDEYHKQFSPAKRRPHAHRSHNV